MLFCFIYSTSTTELGPFHPSAAQRTHCTLESWSSTKNLHEFTWFYLKFSGELANLPDIILAYQGTVLFPAVFLLQPLKLWNRIQCRTLPDEYTFVLVSDHDHLVSCTVQIHKDPLLFGCWFVCNRRSCFSSQVTNILASFKNVVAIRKLNSIQAEMCWIYWFWWNPTLDCWGHGVASYDHPTRMVKSS